ncbi:sensor histidine kinase [Pedobacter sp. GR22-6]|uniref:sensor histidine kinase n=1 Tax=Pedobacter sp. GR22-6 TaxID=3127957 RepID=UPI00307F53CA
MAVQIDHQPGSSSTEGLETLNKLTKLIARLLSVEIVVIHLEDNKNIWCYPETAAAHDPYLLNDPLAAMALGYQFQVSVVLKAKDGSNLGFLSIADEKLRVLTSDEQEILQDLTAIVIDQVETSLAHRQAVFHHQQVLNTTAHDLKNPLTTIPVRADLIKLKKHDPEAIEKMCDQIKIASFNMVRIIDELLHSATAEAGKIRLLLVKLTISDIVANVITMNQPLAERKNQLIHFHSETSAQVKADEVKLSEIVDNLINNAVKYAAHGTEIFVKLREFENNVLISVEDQGQGLTEEDKNRLYQRFTRLSAQPTAGENSTGLGLSIVKLLVEAHEGTIQAESEGRGKGTKFTVILPICS